MCLAGLLSVLLCAQSPSRMEEKVNPTWSSCNCPPSPSPRPFLSRTRLLGFDFPDSPSFDAQHVVCRTESPILIVTSKYCKWSLITSDSLGNVASKHLRRRAQVHHALPAFALPHRVLVSIFVRFLLASLISWSYILNEAKNIELCK